MSQKCFNVLFSFIIRASLLFCLEKSKEKNKSLPTYLIFYQTESRNIFFLGLIYKRNNLWYMLKICGKGLYCCLRVYLQQQCLKYNRSLRGGAKIQLYICRLNDDVFNRTGHFQHEWRNRNVLVTIILLILQTVLHFKMRVSSLLISED